MTRRLSVSTLVGRFATLFTMQCALLCISQSAWAEEDPRSVAGQSVAVTFDRDHEVFPLPELDRFGARNVADPDQFDDPRWRALCQSLDAVRVRLVATAFTVTDRGGVAADWLAGDEVVLSDASEATLRRAIHDGALTPLGRVATAGSAYEPLYVRDRVSRRAALEYDEEAAIGAAVSFPNMTDVSSGLELGARVAPHVNDAQLVAFTVSAVAEAELVDVPSICGPRADLRSRVFVANGVTALRDHETACIRGIAADGTGFVVLLRARTSARVDLPAQLGAAVVAFPSAALCHRQDPAMLYAWSQLESDAEGVPVPWVGERDPLDRPLEPRLTAEAIEVEGLTAGPAHVAFVRTLPGAAESAARRIRDAAERGRAVLSVELPGRGRLVVPFWQGGAPSAFLGELVTRPDGLDVETGCDDCITTTESISMQWTGLAVSLFTGGDGAPRVDVAARWIHNETRQSFPVRRLLAGHSDVTFDSVPFVIGEYERVRLTSLLPSGGARLAAGVEVAVIGLEAEERPVIEVVVNDQPLFVAPGEGARVSHMRGQDRVLNWDWEGSCGMTLRFPEISNVPTGLDVACIPDAESASMRVVGSIFGAPEVLVPAFDTGDGVSELSRLPRLTADTTIPLAGVRRVAWGRGMSLRIGTREASEERPVRSLTVGEGTSESGVLFVEGTRLAFEVGTRVLLPSDCDTYRSNHESGEATTSSEDFAEGVAALIAPESSDVDRGWVTVRGDIELRSFQLRKFQAPHRKDIAVNLALPAASVRSVALAIPRGRSVELECGASRPVRISVAAAAVEDEE